MGSKLSVAKFIIANGATDSQEVDLSEHVIVGFQIATFTGATFSFKARATDHPKEALSAVVVVDNAGNAITVTATDDRYLALDEEPGLNLASLRFVTIVSASAEAAARTVYAVLEARI